VGNRIVEVHTHDNHGLRDEHRWPGDGTIDWTAMAEALKGLSAHPAIVLEIANELSEPIASLPDRIQQSFERF